MREYLQQFLSSVFLIALSVTCSILVNIYGWGLTPRSWWWIIGVGLFVMVVLGMLLDALTKKGK